MKKKRTIRTNREKEGQKEGQFQERTEGEKKGLSFLKKDVWSPCFRMKK